MNFQNEINNDIKFLAKSEIRLKILSELYEGPNNIRGLVKNTNITYSSVSSNISKLEQNDHIEKIDNKYHINPMSEIYFKTLMDFKTSVDLITDFNDFWDEHNLNQLSIDCIMNITDLKEYLGRDWEAVQERIDTSLRSDISLLNTTNESILSNSGKQLRPLLSLFMARACTGGKPVEDATVRYAAASELLHNATLLHDDVADESDLRRGKPTIYSLMGPSVSVLVGDYWLVKAMDLILGNSGSDTAVIRLFSKTLSDLAEGEMLQLQKAQAGDTDENDYLRIIYNKTASLFEAACVSAALSVNASEEMIAAAKDYAVALGLAFQIKDDILDYSGTESVGKPLGVDILEQKITMPLLGALEEASSEQAAKVRDMVKEIPGHPEYRDEILTFVTSGGGVEYAKRRLDDYVAKAVAALEVFPDSYEKNCLAELARYTAIRNR